MVHLSRIFKQHLHPLEALTEILQYSFIQNALLIALFSGISCGIVGSYIVARRSVFLGGGVTHASFGGIGLAYLLGLNALWGAAVFAVAASLGIEYFERKGGIRKDSAIGIVWSVGMALGIICIHFTPGYTPDATSILFGNILTVPHSTIVASGILAAIVLIISIVWHRPIMFSAFDVDFARSQGVHTGVIAYSMAIITALTLVFSIQAIGIVMLISLLTFPAVIVGTLTKSYRKIACWSAVVAVVSNIAGLIFSYVWGIPTGAATIFTLAVSLIIVKMLSLYLNRKTLRANR